MTARDDRTAGTGVAGGVYPGCGTRVVPGMQYRTPSIKLRVTRYIKISLGLGPCRRLIDLKNLINNLSPDRLQERRPDRLQERRPDRLQGLTALPLGLTALPLGLTALPLEQS